MSTHHYFLASSSTKSKSTIINPNSHLQSSHPSPILISRKIYNPTPLAIKTNRTISLSENEVISELDIFDEYYVTEVSNKCRLLYNSQITILEMDGKSHETALKVFSLISNIPENEIIFFDINDDKIR